MACLAASTTATSAGQAATPAAQVGASPSSVIASHACADEIGRTLRAWSAGPEATQSADGPLGVRLLTIPTDALGVWIVLRLASDGSADARRVDADSVETRRWTSTIRPGRRRASCALAATTSNASELPGANRPDAFTDADLSALLAEGRTGVLYVWSPHMPLSVSGFASIATAAERLGIDLVPLLDPLADPRYAADAIARATLPPRAARPLSSVELTFRQMTTHAPSVQVFESGALVGPMLPGYRGPDGYVDFIRRALNASTR